MGTLRKVLMIAYFFPPIGGIGSAGSQRVLKFAKYLPDSQWTPVILTVRPEYYESYLSVDPILLEKVPTGMVVVRTRVVRWLTKLLKMKHHLTTLWASRPDERAGAADTKRQSEMVKDIGDDSSRAKSWYQRVKDSITDLFDIPDEEMGWFLPAVAGGWMTMRRERVDVIYSTGRPWTAHLIGLALKLLTGKPLVVDFRDPWITNPFRLQYSWFKEILERNMERTVIEHADVVIANTEELQAEFAVRYSNQPRAKFVSILNGFDPDDYDALPQATPQNSAEYFTVTHTGFLYGKRDPKIFLEAVKMLVNQPCVDRKRFRVRLIGAVALPYNLNDYLFSNKIDDIVQLRDHVPFKDSLEYMRQSTLLLLLQPGTTTQVPSKLFEYIGMRKPILAISPKRGATSSIVRSEGVGEVADPDNTDEIVEALGRLYHQWRSNTSLCATYESAYQKFNVKNMTRQLAEQLPQ